MIFWKKPKDIFIRNFLCKLNNSIFFRKCQFIKEILNKWSSKKYKNKFCWVFVGVCWVYGLGEPKKAFFATRKWPYAPRNQVVRGSSKILETAGAVARPRPARRTAWFAGHMAILSAETRIWTKFFGNFQFIKEITNKNFFFF